jgi:hypothetical protein
MIETLDAFNQLTEELEKKVKSGVSLHDKSVYRALNMPQVREKLSEMLSRGLAFENARALASSDPEIAEVLCTFSSDGQPLPITLKIFFKGATNVFVSLLEQTSHLDSDVDGLGALPFVLAAPSFSQTGSTASTNPIFRSMEERRELFTRVIVGDHASTIAIYSATGTPVNTDVPTKYGTSAKSTANGDDYDTEDDFSTDHEYDTPTADE